MKARYEVKKSGKILYFCVTTTRNTEDMINILRERFEDLHDVFKIYRIMDGVRMLVYEYTIHSCRKVREKETGKIYDSVKHYATAAGLKRTTVYGWLYEGKKGEYSREFKKKIPIEYAA